MTEDVSHSPNLHLSFALFFSSLPHSLTDSLLCLLLCHSAYLRPPSPSPNPANQNPFLLPLLFPRATHEPAINHTQQATNQSKKGEKATKPHHRKNKRQSGLRIKSSPKRGEETFNMDTSFSISSTAASSSSSHMTAAGATHNHNHNHGQVLDGSDIMELVGNERVFSSFVDHKFSELDRDRDGHLSVKELHPAVADIGAALGLPAQGSSPDSDLIYSEVLKEFTHGKQEKVSKREFKEVLSDILIGMAAGLKRDPVVILRIDGEDLLEFINGPGYEPEMVSIFSELESSDACSLHDCIVKAFEKLTVDQGIPPCSDSWVVSNILEPSLQLVADQEQDKPAASQDAFLAAFKKAAECVAQRLKEHPVIVAHTENTFDGSGIRRLLSNKFELDKTLNSTLENLPKDRNGRISKEYLRMTLDAVSPSAGLPPIGALDEMDQVINEALKLVNADDGKQLKEDEFKKIVAEMLGSIMLQLEGNPISVSSNSVVHEPIASASTLLQPSS